MPAGFRFHGSQTALILIIVRVPPAPASPVAAGTPSVGAGSRMRRTGLPSVRCKLKPRRFWQGTNIRACQYGESRVAAGRAWHASS